jgi:hypothetical protein
MYPFCVALLAGCLVRPAYVPAPPVFPGPARPPATIYVPMPPPQQMAPNDPRIAPAPKQYYEPAPDRVWAKLRSKKYHCPNSPHYGEGHGVYLSEADATMSGFQPMVGGACFRAR